jgi:hypothetical protein
MTYLVLYDADRIKEYVFTTGRLKEIRGASAIVRMLTEAPLQGLKEAGWSRADAVEPIYTDGGAGALLCPTLADAEALCSRLERLYRQKTGGATLSAVHVEVRGSGPAAEAEAQSRAARALARRKASKPIAEALPGGTLLRFCASDRLRPATVAATDPDGGQELLGSAAVAKRRHSNAERAQLAASAFWRDFIAELQTLNSAVAVAQWERAIFDSQDLGSIAAQSRPKGYVALVYADGDGVGERIRRVVASHGFAGYRNFSAALSAAARRATAHALARAYSSRPPAPQRLTIGGRTVTRPCLPFEVVTIGGDDVLLFCTAEYGLQIAADLSERFKQVMADELTSLGLPAAEATTASVGVVISHAGVPIAQLEQRGRELLKSAKRAAGETGGVDFHLVTTPALESLGVLRATGYQLGDGIELTMRPYSGARLRTLLAHARALDVAPEPLSGSKRADLYHACRGSQLVATLEVLAVHGRLPSSQRVALLEALADLDSADPYPFGRPAGAKFQTALLDLLEAIEFAGKPGGW